MKSFLAKPIFLIQDWLLLTQLCFKLRVIHNYYHLCSIWFSYHFISSIKLIYFYLNKSKYYILLFLLLIGLGEWSWNNQHFGFQLYSKNWRYDVRPYNKYCVKTASIGQQLTRLPVPFRWTCTQFDGQNPFIFDDSILLLTFQWYRLKTVIENYKENISIEWLHNHISTLRRLTTHQP